MVSGRKWGSCSLHAVLAVLLIGPLSAQQPQISSLDRERAQQMLENVEDEIHKHYYDPKYHGVDLNAEFNAAKERISVVTSMNMALANIAAAVDTLNDNSSGSVIEGGTTTKSPAWIR